MYTVLFNTVTNSIHFQTYISRVFMSLPTGTQAFTHLTFIRGMANFNENARKNNISLPPPPPPYNIDFTDQSKNMITCYFKYCVLFSVISVSILFHLVYVYHYWTAGGNFGWPKNRFWLNFSPFQINTELWFFFTKWLPAAILDDRKSLLITFLAISDQYATFFFIFFSQNGCRRPFWMTENHVRSHFSPIQINMQLFFYLVLKMAVGGHFG